MTSILDKIKGLLVEIGIDIKNNAISGNRFILFHNEIHQEKITNNYFILDKDRNIEGLNLAALDNSQDKKLGELLRSAEKGTFIARNDTKKLISDVSTTVQLKSNSETITFFADKIPPQDVSILIASLVIRDKFRQRQMDEVSGLRSQLRYQYGERALEISNLCTAGYFENFLKPLYAEMSKVTGFTNDDYVREYLKLINEFPVAIFINSKMNEQDIDGEIKDKIKFNKKYGIPYLNIHGIGKTNIKNILTAINKLKHREDYTFRQTEQHDLLIIVRLRFD